MISSSLDKLPLSDSKPSIQWQIQYYCFWLLVLLAHHYDIIFFYKNHVYKNVVAQICLKFKNIVVILLVAISISFPASDEI